MTTPIRTCVGCRRRRPQRELLRIVRSPAGDQPVTVQLDPHQRLPGRGTYLCPDPGCVERAARRGGQALVRALRGAPAAEVQIALDQARQVATDVHPPAATPAPERAGPGHRPRRSENA